MPNSKSTLIIVMTYIIAFAIFCLGAQAQIEKPAEPIAQKVLPTSSPMSNPALSNSSTALKTPKKKVRRKKLKKMFAVMETSMGTIKFRLYYKRAPHTVENFVGLAEGTKEFKDKKGKKAKRPFYDGLTFHRVIKGFMIQTGCPFGNGLGGTGDTIRGELHPNLLHDKEGVVAMANAGGNPNLASSQFYITLAPKQFLDKDRMQGKGYSVFGQVVEGMDVVKAISVVDTNRANDKPSKEVLVKHIKIERVY